MLKMKDEFNTLIEKAIQLELNVAELYIHFYRLFPSDAAFWWELAIEEKNHAALLKTLQQMKNAYVDIPDEFYPAGKEALEESNKKISSAIREFDKNPDRTRAFHTAYEIENSAGEIHYESFAKSISSSQVATIFKKLNGGDINHAARIRNYMSEVGIS